MNLSLRITALLVGVLLSLGSGPVCAEAAYSSVRIYDMKDLYAIPALVNDKTVATFIIDTGASHTVISKHFAEKLGVKVTPEMPRVKISTANGIVFAPKVRLRNFTVGEMTVVNLEVIIMDLAKDDPLLGGLLGLNFFRSMNWRISENHLILERRGVTAAQ